jgi:hypothetical protein
MYSSHPEPNNTWTEVSHKRGRLAHEDEETQREGKHIKQSEYCLHATPTTNCYTALLEKDNDQQHKVGPGNTPKPPSIYASDFITISPLIQLLEQIVKQQYEL